MDLGRLLRTASRLHPLQIGTRLPRELLGGFAHHVPAGASPRARASWPLAPEVMAGLANAERTRGEDRATRVAGDPRLHAYEACYGLELGADDRAPPGDWRAPVALDPFPASVRARRIAVAMRHGRQGLTRELTRAARAVALQPELHLLGNHLLENGFGLACAGAVTSGPEADFWWWLGSRLLSWQLPAQFLADGGHVERSASYHLALSAALVELLELADASGRGAPALWRETASGALGWLTAVRAPDSTYPLFNDAALDAAPPLDLVLACGAAVGVRPRRQDRLEATGWERLDVPDATVVVDAGPDAGGWQPGHCHADGLTFELWVRGRRCVVDFGVSTYEQRAGRAETRATRSHNTVELDGRDSCEVWGAFRVGRRGTGRTLSRTSVDGGVRLELEHDGYAWLPGGPRHTRVMTLRPGRLEVHDRILGAAVPGEAVTRLRVDPAPRVDFSGTSPVTRLEGAWHPRHADPRPALVLEQKWPAGDARGVRWRVEW